MRFTLENKTLMHKELSLLRATVADKKATIPALALTRLEANGKSGLRLTATDLDQTLSCETTASIQKAGSIALSTKKLHEIFSELPADKPISFERKENNRVLVACGASKFTLAGAKFIMRQKGVRMVTTDGHRLALVDNRTVRNSTELDCLIPQNALLALVRLSAIHEGAVGISCDENHIYFEIGARTLITRTLTGQFPNYEMILPKGYDKKVPFECAELLASVRRVAVLSDAKSHALVLRFTENKLTISAEETETGAGEETIDVPYGLPPVAIGINSEYLTDYLSVIGTGAVSFEFKEAKGAINVRATGEAGVNSYSIIMPLNLPDEVTSVGHDQTNEAASDKETAAEDARESDEVSPHAA